MLNILVVDDERVEREGIQLLIEEYQLPLRMATAANGKEALAYLADRAADILITDIKMPFVNGLELAGTVRRLYPGVKIIIFSAYGEFEYAKKAIDLNVVHYILKPVVIDEFLQVMTQVIRLCEQEIVQREREEQLAKEYARRERYEIEHGLLRILHGTDPDCLRVNRAAGSASWFTPMRLVLFEFRQRFFDVHNNGFIEKLTSLIGNERHFEYVNLNEYQSIAFVRDDGAQEQTEASWQTKWETVKTRVDECFDSPVCIILGKRLVKSEEIQFEFQRLEQWSEYKYAYDRGIVVITDPHLSWYQAADARTAQPPSSLGEQDNRTVGSILHIIHTQYMEDLSLDAVADTVRLSPGYVSGLFKKGTGQSFVKYLTDYRMEKAKELLLETNLKIGDIAQKVGYADSSYFGTVFRGRFGASPAKFRGNEEAT